MLTILSLIVSALINILTVSPCQQAHILYIYISKLYTLTFVFISMVNNLAHVPPYKFPLGEPPFGLFGLEHKMKPYQLTTKSQAKNAINFAIFQTTRDDQRKHRAA